MLFDRLNPLLLLNACMGHTPTLTLEHKLHPLHKRHEKAQHLANEVFHVD
jgi:hypothetical protein